jgi:hypothetical protein
MEKRFRSIIKRKGDILILNKFWIIEIIQDNKNNTSKIPDND